MKEIDDIILEYNISHEISGLYDEYVNLLLSEGLGSDKIFEHLTEKIKTDGNNPNHYFHLFEHYLWKKDFDKAFEILESFKNYFPEISPQDIETWKNIINRNKEHLIAKKMKRQDIDICSILY